MSAAVFLAIASLLAGALAFPMTLLILSPGGLGGSGVAIGLVALVAYPILGFIGGLLGAVIYNTVARVTGGVIVKPKDA